MSVTPQSGRTVSLTSNKTPAKSGPTPKNEFKVPKNHRNCFSSPTDALVSPCTQKLMKSRRMPRKMHAMSLRPRQVDSYRAHSSLADKENQHCAPAPPTTTITTTTTEDKPDAKPDVPANAENESS